MRFRINIILSFGFIFFACLTNKNAFSVKSPNNDIAVQFYASGDDYFYNVTFNGKKVINNSKVGLIFKNSSQFPIGQSIINVEKSFKKETWELPWGEKRLVNDSYNEAIISFKDNLNKKTGEITFRVYDDGIAFRYTMKKIDKDLDSLILTDELTEFSLIEDGHTWWTPAYTDNRYEELYQRSKVSQMDTSHTPLTIRYTDGTHLSIHEASLTNYSSMQLRSSHHTLNCDLAPWKNGDKVRLQLPFKSPWRTVIISEDAGGLIMSDLMLNCNEPSQIENTSWIKPSKYIGIWWGMIIGKWTWNEGFRHGATNERSQDYIDFASKHGIDEVLIEGWASGWESLFPKDSVTVSFTKSTPDFDIKKIQEYAKSKGVSIQSYHETMAHTKNYLAQIDSAFSMLNDLGIRNVKIGHVGSKLDGSEFHYGQFGVQYYRHVLNKALQYELGVNFHEPIKDTGERRTFPNMLTREGARGMEYNAWPSGNPPSHTLILPFTRLLGSPMDFTPGILDILYDNLDKTEDIEFPLTITVVDSGNNFSNLRFKCSESIWFDKDMDSKTRYVDGKRLTFWTIVQDFQVGKWEWGVTADHPKTNKNNAWLLEALDIKNNLSISIDENGKISGNDTLFIPFLDLESSNAIPITGYPPAKIQRISSTLSKQLALYVIIHSPLQMAADFIENYDRYPTSFQFIKDVPVSWDTTIVLNGEIEEYLTIARKDRNSTDWYIGGITNEKKRILQFDLSFLNEGKYEATIYSDDENSDWLSDPMSQKTFRKTVSKNESITMKLASGGGQAIRLKKLND